MIPLRTAPNPAFKIVQPLPTLAADLPVGRKCPVPFGIPGPPRWGAGELKSPAPVRRPTNEGAQPKE